MDASRTLSELGKTCWLAGRPHEAEPLLRNSIELARPLQEHAFLRCGPLIVNSLSYLSGVVAELGHDGEAEGYDREALAIARRLYALQPDVHVKTLANQLYQTAAVLWFSHADEAEELYAEERRLLEARVGSGDKELVSLLALCRRAAGCFYSSRGDHERAAKELRAACGIYHELHERRSGLVHLKDYAECLAALQVSTELSETATASAPPTARQSASTALPATRTMPTRSSACLRRRRARAPDEKNAAPDEKGRDPGAPALAVALSVP